MAQLQSSSVTGSLIVSGALEVLGVFSGSIESAATASYVNPLNQDVEITGSLSVVNGTTVLQPNTTGPTATNALEVKNSLGTTVVLLKNNGTSVFNDQIQVPYFGSPNGRILFGSNSVTIGGGYTTVPSSRLMVRGSGTTSSTTALRVENSNASASLLVDDAGNVAIAPDGNISGSLSIGPQSSLNYGSRVLTIHSYDDPRIVLQSHGTWKQWNIKGGSNTALKIYQSGGSTNSDIEFGATSTPGTTLKIYNENDAFIEAGNNVGAKTVKLSLTDQPNSYTGNFAVDVAYGVNTFSRFKFYKTGNLEMTGSLLASGVELSGSGATITGSLNVLGNINHDGDLTVSGTVTAQEFKTEFVSASIIYRSGSTKFGDTFDDKHEYTGSLEVTGSVGINTDTNEARFHVYNPADGGSVRTAVFEHRWGVNSIDQYARYGVIVKSADQGTSLGITNQPYNSVLQGTTYSSPYTYKGITLNPLGGSVAIGRNLVGGPDDSGAKFIVSGSSKFEGDVVVSGSGGNTFETYHESGANGSGIKLTRTTDGYQGRIYFNSVYQFPDNGGSFKFGSSNSAQFSGTSAAITQRNLSPTFTWIAGDNSGKGFYLQAPAADDSFQLYLHDNYNQQNVRKVMSFSNQSDFTLHKSGSSDSLLFVSQSGNIGIGTIAPSSKLHIVAPAFTTGNTYSGLYLSIDSSNTGKGNYGPGIIFGGTAVGNTGVNQDGAAIFGLQGSDDADNVGLGFALRSDSNSTNRFPAAVLVTTSGGSSVPRFGIGTVDPDYTLDVNGDAQISGKIYTDDGLENSYLRYGQVNGIQDEGDYTVILFPVSGSDPDSEDQNYADGTYYIRRSTSLLAATSVDVHINTNDHGSAVGYLNVNNVQDDEFEISAVTIQTGSAWYAGIRISGSALPRGAGYYNGFINNSDNNAFTVKDNTDADVTIVDTISSFGADNSGTAIQAISQADESLFKKVGIGTTTPEYTLDVSGSGVRFYHGYSSRFTFGRGINEYHAQMSTITHMTLQSGGAGIFRIQRGGASNINFQVDAQDNVSVGKSAAMFVSSSGKVGIGTTTPSYMLDVVGAGGTDGVIRSRRMIATGGTAADPAITTASTIAGLYEPSYGRLGLVARGQEVIRLVNNPQNDMLALVGTTTGTARLQVKGFGNTSASASLLVENADSTTSFAVLDNGNVGIGTTSPGSALEVAGTIYQDAEAGIDNYFRTNHSQKSSTTTLNPGILVYGNGTQSANSNYGMDLGYDSVTAKYRTRIFTSPTQDISFGKLISPATAQSNFTEQVTIKGPTGNVGIGTTSPAEKLTVEGNISGSGNLVVEGSIEGASKSFNIPHPTLEGKRLIYGSLEGPEHGVYARGKVEGSVIELPDYWVNLVDEDTITVQLTSIGKHQNLYVKDIKDNKVFIGNGNLLSSSIKAFYFIQAMRKDIDKLQTVR